MKTTKRIISLVLAVVTLMSVMGIAVNAYYAEIAANGGYTKTDYGYLLPTNANGTKTVSTVKLYGAYDYLDLRINAKRNNVDFFYFIFSDKKCTDLVESGTYSDCRKKGVYDKSLRIKLKGIYKSGTYYCETMACYYDNDGNVFISKPSMKKIKIVVDRTTSFAKQMVILKNVSNTVNGPKVTWSALSGASKYCVYRRPMNGTKWTLVGTTKASVTSFTDTSVKNKNGKYVYTVKAVNKNGTASRYYYQGLDCLYAAAPVLTSVTTLADNQVKLQWKNVSSSAYYDVYRKYSGENGWVKIAGNCKKTYFYDKTAIGGTKYDYTVRANIKTADGVARSAYYSNADKAHLFLWAPEIYSIIDVDGYPLISWMLDTEATAYTIYRRSIDGSTGWKTLGKVSGKTAEYRDTTASRNGKYIYTVRAEAGKVKGSYLTAGYPYVYLPMPEVESCGEVNGGYITLTWDAVPNAQCYDVYLLDDNYEVERIEYEDITMTEAAVPVYSQGCMFAVMAKATYYDSMAKKTHNLESSYGYHTVYTDF